MQREAIQWGGFSKRKVDAEAKIMEGKGNPLRILHVVHAMVVGGAERVIADLIHAGRDQNLEAQICCLDNEGAMAQELREEGIPVHVLGRRPGLDARIPLQLRALIRKEKISVIHAHQYTPWFYASLAYPMSGASRLIFTEHGRFHPDVRKKRRVIANQILHPLSHSLVAISQATRDALVQIDGFPSRRIQIIYNGIDPTPYETIKPQTDIRAELGWPDPEVRIVGLIARFDPIKNIAMLIRAFADVHKHMPYARLLLVGDGPEREALEKQCDALRLRKVVRFTGIRRDIPALLHAMDVFALPSFSEGTSITLLEAMASALPIVATRVGGNPELILHSENGYLVGNNDQADFSRRLLELLTHPEKRQAMGKAGRQRLHRLFSRQRMAEHYEKLYGVRSNECSP